MNTAYRIYDDAKDGTIFKDLKEEGYPDITVVGRLEYNFANPGNWVLVGEEYSAIDEKMKENLGVMNAASGQKGSILDTGTWSLLANDSWLLGGLHACTNFHFASPPYIENLWDENKGRMTVMGRELIGIVSFGYKIKRPDPNLEHVATCENKTKALGSTLPKYKDAVLQYTTKEDLSEIAAAAGQPAITELNPDEGNADTLFTIYGKELFDGKVYFIQGTDYSLALTSSTRLTQIQARVPRGLTAGDYDVQVNTINPTPSNRLKFTVTGES